MANYAILVRARLLAHRIGDERRKGRRHHNTGWREYYAEAKHRLRRSARDGQPALTRTCPKPSAVTSGLHPRPSAAV